MPVNTKIIRMADWPAKGWAEKQEDLPRFLVGAAREYIQILK